LRNTAIRYLALDVGGSCDGVFFGCIHAPHDDGAIQASACDKLGVGGPGYAVDLKFMIISSNGSLKLNIRYKPEKS
jgi:hypothetical protein